MPHQEFPSITIEPGTMINTGLHEDDDYFIAENPVDAQVVGEQENGAVRIIIPSIDPDRVFFLHRPEKPKSIITP